MASQLSMKSSAVDAHILCAQSAAAEAQNQTLKHDKKIWREDYLRSKKGNVLRKTRKDSAQRIGDKKSANKLRKSRGKGSVYVF